MSDAPQPLAGTLMASRAARIRPGLRGPAEPTLGTWVKLPTLETLEMLAYAGFEFVVIDMEHSPLGLETVYRLIFGSQALGMAALIRVADRSGNLYQRLLDSGADGLLVPQVSTLEQARAAVAGMTFAPSGTRGMGATARAGHWGLAGAQGYLASGDDIVRGIQIEDLDALRDVERYLELDQLDAIFLGMGDLTMSSRRAFDDAEIRTLTDRMIELARDRGIPCGTAVADPSGAAHAAARGFSFIMVSNDTTMFGNAATSMGREALAALRP
jgi:2-dehydro-3-deoxyglucarate aldolase/4-hydroxy-2-oxoheptanedioate aldolase